MKNPTALDKTITSPIVPVAMPQPRIVVKVFSATMHKEREFLGEKVTDWLTVNHGKIEVDDIRTMQSSDNQFHCVTIIVFAHELEVARG